MKQYTIREAAKQLGIAKNRIMRLIVRGKIAATKGKNARSPYQIDETELPKIKELLGSLATHREPTVVTKTPTAAQPEMIAIGKQYEELRHMQKLLAETMRELATTQEQIAATLHDLVKKV